MSRLARLLLLLVAVTALATGSSPAATGNVVRLPDMKMVMPTDSISIGLDKTDQRELRFSHITANLGPGEFEIDPHYNKKTGLSTFTQALHGKNGSIVKRVPLATYGTWDPPNRYRYPLSSFTLNRARTGGGVGVVVGRSLKAEYCIAGFVQVPGYKNPPRVSFIPPTNCNDRSNRLGWSAGWGDRYDQYDSGQPISLAGVPDGTYILRATADPEHVLHEVTTANDVTDTKLKIVGTDVTVLSQHVRNVKLPLVRVTGRRTLTATVSPPPGKTVRSVQFIVDGLPAGHPRKTAPYKYTVTAPAGVHYVSARATVTKGVMGSAPVRRIVVRATSTLVLPLDTRPAVHLLNPGPNQTVTGIRPVAIEVTDAVGVVTVRLSVDGNPLGAVLRSPLSHVSWDTRTLKNGPHVLAARVTSATGRSTVTRETVVVSNPAPPMTCYILQHQATVRGKGVVKTAAFRTAVEEETLLALVSADGPRVGHQTTVVTGGGLKWKLVSRANARPGAAEVWEAEASTPTLISPITATLTSGGYAVSLSVIAMEGTDGVGANAHASGKSGAPHLTLKTHAATSLVFAAGNDGDRAAPRKLPVGWVIHNQWLNTGTAGTYWSQYTNQPTGKAGERVSVRVTAPLNDTWNLAAVELLSDD